MGKIFKIDFDSRNRNMAESRRFWQNIAEKGSVGTNDPETCHHPVTNVVGIKLTHLGALNKPFKETELIPAFSHIMLSTYCLVYCRDCGTTIRIVKQGKK